MPTHFIIAQDGALDVSDCNTDRAGTLGSCGTRRLDRKDILPAANDEDVAIRNYVVSGGGLSGHSVGGRQVFDYFDGHQFAVFGRNEANPPWFQSMDRIQAAVPSPMYPVFNGGLQYFKQSAQAEDIFRRSKRLFRDYDNLQLRRNNKRENDEPLVSLAMAQAGLMAKGVPCLDVMFAPERPLFKFHINVLAGESWFYRCGRLVRPVIVHFVGIRDTCYEYLREELRLEIAFRDPFFPYWHERVIQMSAYGEWLLTGRNLQENTASALAHQESS